MTTAPPDRLLTAEEFGERVDDGHDYELVKGRLVEVPPSFYISSVVATAIAILVGSVVRLHKLGIRGGEGGGVKTGAGPDTVRAPDFSFMSKERIPAGGLPRRLYLPSPDLAVEVRSPTAHVSDLIDKVYEYLDAGTRLVWLVLPDERAVMVFRSNRRPVKLKGEAALEGEDVLPGFSVPLPEL